MNPGKLPVNVGIFKIIRLYRLNFKKMKNFFWVFRIVSSASFDFSWQAHGYGRYAWSNQRKVFINKHIDLNH
jgi:hypothetical protein